MNKKEFLRKVGLAKKKTYPTTYSYELVPDTFSCFDKIPIVCKQHGVFYQKASSHIHGQGCRSCYNESILLLRGSGTSEFVNKSKKIYGDKFSYHNTNCKTVNDQVTVTCSLHGDVVVTPKSHFRIKFGCPKCSDELTKKYKREEIIKLSNEVHGNRYDYSKFIFTNVNEKAEIICPIHGSFFQNVRSHFGAKKCGCPKCSRVNTRLTLEQFLANAKAVHGEKYDYSKTVYTTSLEDVIITCKKHGDWSQRAHSHLSGNGCLKCNQELRILPLDDFIKSAKEIHGDKYDYSKVVYTGNKNKVEIICPKHGSFWTKPNSHVSSRNGCQLCQESKGERAIEIILNKYGIDFIREYRIEPQKFRYDFYLPDFNIYIEFHGKQHYCPVELFGGEKEFLLTKKRDMMKLKLVCETGAELIVVNYLNLNAGMLESILINKLKRVYHCWYLINKKITVFKSVLDVYRVFNIPTNIIVEEEFINEIRKQIPDFKILF